MSGLTPNLFERRFQDLIEIGRARLPSLAPDWTDHNAHDPGITLMELLAWVSEAQLYSLARLRRDERMAYAALLGLTPAGTQGATGLIWSDRLDLTSPMRTFAKTAVLPEDTVINVQGSETPTFRPMEKLLWVPGRIDRLETRRADGTTVDHTTMNERGSVAFLPFGETAGRRNVLAMTFTCHDRDGIFGNNRPNTKGARWVIGVQAAPPLGGATINAAEPSQTNHSPLEAMLIDGDVRASVKIASDSTQGLLTTGALLLDLDEVASSPGKFTIELRSSNGFPRPPRVLRIDPSVIPIRQGRRILSEPHEATGLPDWSFPLDSLESSGLRFAREEEPLTLSVMESTGETTWRRDRLFEQGPRDNVYELDVKSGQVTFGNGVNGRIPPTGSQVLVTYAVSDAERGGVARNRKWKVAGFEGVLGVNLDPIAGGASSSEWIEERREARRRSREDHALVSADDIAEAATALPLLEVTRAWVPPPDEKAPRTGVVRLVAMRGRPAGIEPEQAPETARWLEAIRRRLAERMPLGTRLVVSAPRYVRFSLHTTIEAIVGRDPVTVQDAINQALRKRLALVSTAEGGPPRQPGIPVTHRDIGAWMRAIDGVRRVIELRMVRADGQTVDEIAVPRSGLPRWNAGRSTIDVRRPEIGGLR